MTIFLSSDLHLNHTNIIKYCKRPFKTVEQMNNTIIKRWNEVVSTEDTVYFLGDFCMGDPLLWLAKLKGDIRFIQGNHDKELSKIRRMRDHIIIEHNHESILLIHSTEYLQGPWNGWIIHGHNHNNSPKEFPLINKANKTINISAEMVDYQPVELETILGMR
jgi:calcineurin-like phosphoesterase family protein